VGTGVPAAENGIDVFEYAVSDDGGAPVNLVDTGNATSGLSGCPAGFVAGP
jgi:hypothetical protein